MLGVVGNFLRRTKNLLFKTHIYGAVKQKHITYTCKYVYEHTGMCMYGHTGMCMLHVTCHMYLICVMGLRCHLHGWVFSEKKLSR